MSPVERWCRCYSSGLNDVNIATFSVKRRKRSYFFGQLHLMPLFFQLEAVNASILPIERR